MFKMSTDILSRGPLVMAGAETGHEWPCLILVPRKVEWDKAFVKLMMINGQGIKLGSTNTH